MSFRPSPDSLHPEFELPARIRTNNFPNLLEHFNVFGSQTIQLTTAEENCKPMANASPFKGLQ